jgi:predicted TIM-barrel fold metal-dependent hydrolase
VFDRHPRLRFAVVENGSAWVSDLLKKLDLAATQSAGWFTEPPSDIFRRHVWVTPFWEDDPADAAEIIGVERTLFGSDWPHAEGIAEPLSYADAIAPLGDVAVRRIMRDNFRELTS